MICMRNWRDKRKIKTSLQKDAECNRGLAGGYLFVLGPRTFWDTAYSRRHHARGPRGRAEPGDPQGGLSPHLLTWQGGSQLEPRRSQANGQDWLAVRNDSRRPGAACQVLIFLLGVTRQAFAYPPT